MNNKEPETTYTINVSLNGHRQPTADDLREFRQRINAKLKEITDAVFSPELVKAYRQLKEALEQQPDLPEEEQRELEEARSFLDVYEQHMEATGTPPTVSDLEKIARRKPLPKVSKYHIMNDNAVDKLVSEPGLEIEYLGIKMENNGQMRFAWEVPERKGKKGKEDVSVYISMYSERLTALQNSIISGIGSCIVEWKKKNSGGVWLSPDEIWRAMHGKRNNETPSAKQRQEIIENIDMLRRNPMVLNFDELLQNKMIDTTDFDDDRIVGGIMEDYAINAVKGRFLMSRHKTPVEGYYFEHAPLILAFNALQDHIIKIDSRFIDFPGSGRQNAIVFRDYFLRRINGYREGHLDSNRILLVNLYQHTGITPPEERISADDYETRDKYRKALTKIRKGDNEIIDNILSTLKEKEFIKDFSPVKTGRNLIIGYDFIADRDTKRTKRINVQN